MSPGPDDTQPSTTPDQTKEGYGVTPDFEKEMKSWGPGQLEAFWRDTVNNLVSQGVPVLPYTSPTSDSTFQDRVNKILDDYVAELSGDPDAAKGDAYTHSTADQPLNNAAVNVAQGADPVNLFNGNFLYSTTDFQIDGAGADFVFARTYSQLTAYHGPLGYCWDHTYNLWLRVFSDNRIIHRSTGALGEELYKKHEQFDYWIPPDGATGIILENGDSFLYRLPDGTTIFYQPHQTLHPSMHVAARIEDRFGNYLNFVYADGLLARAEVNHPGRHLDFRYDSENRIVSIRDFSGRVWRYDYDDLGDLAAVTTPATAQHKSGLTTRYMYAGALTSDANLQHCLTAIFDADGFLYLENQFGDGANLVSYRRVVRQRQGSGEIYFDYADVVEDFDFAYASHERPTCQTIVTERDGTQARYLFNRAGNMVFKEEYARLGGIPKLISTHFRYNKDGNLVGSLSPLGVIVQYVFGREAYERRFPSDDDYRAETDPNLTAHERQAFNKVMSVVRRGRYYDVNSLNLSRGLWASDLFPDVFQTNDQDRIQKFDYEPEFLQVLTVSDPRFTESTDPAFSENADYHAHLTRYGYAPGSGHQHLFLHTVELPATVSPDGSPHAGLKTEFAMYASKGRPRRVIAANGLETEITYFQPGDGTLDGFSKETRVDAGGLNLRTGAERDALGRCVKAFRPKFYEFLNGRFSETTEYDELGRVLSTTTSAPFNFSTHYEYGRTGNLVRTQIALKDQHNADEGVFETRNRFDEEFHLEEQRVGDFEAGVFKRSRVLFDRAGRAYFSISASGRKRKVQYNERSLVYKSIEDYGGVHAITRMYYDADGNLVRLINPRGFTSNFTYDSFGQMVVAQNPLGDKTVLHYDKAGNIIVACRFEKNPDDTYSLLFRQESVYDAQGRKIVSGVNKFESAAPLPENQLSAAFIQSGPGVLLRIQYFYDDAGNLVKVIDQNNREFRTEYDKLGRISIRTDPFGNQIRFTYDSESNIVRTDRKEVTRDKTTNTIVGTRWFAETFQFDELNRLVQKTNTLGNALGYRYDSRNNEVEIIDPLNNKIENSYDTFGRLVQTQPVGIGYAYDPDDNITTQTDALGRTTIFVYDSAGRLVSTILPDRSADELKYDRLGNVIEYRDRNGLVNLAWDGLNRNTLTQIDASGVPAGVEIAGATAYSTTFDALNRIVQVENDFVRTSFRFNSLHHTLDERTVFKTVPALAATEFTIQREFDNTNQLVKLIYPSQREIRLTRDVLGRILAIEQAHKGNGYPGAPGLPDAATLAEFDYEGLQRKRISRHNGTTTEYAYDFGGRIAAIRHATAQADILTIQMLYNAVGDLQCKLERSAVGRATEHYQYDALFRLTATDRSPAASLLNLSVIAPATAPLPDPIPSFQDQIDQLVPPAAPPSEVAYHYDLAGNRQTVVNGPNTKQYATNALDQYETVDGTAFRYDANGNLAEDATHVYSYDYRNQLAKVVHKADGHETRYLYDTFGRRCVHRELGAARVTLYDTHNMLEEYEGAVLRASVLTDTIQDNLLISARAGRDFYLYSDLTRSVRSLFREGQPFNFYEYDAFGNVVNTQIPNDGNAFRFAGKALLPDIGKYDFVFRAYDPATGKFMQRDPLGYADGTNLYVYGGNNPLVVTDPYGLDSRPEHTIQTRLYALRAASTPLDRSGKPLSGTYNLWSDDVNGLPKARNAPGWIMEQTPEHLTAEINERNYYATHPGQTQLPPDVKDKIWVKPSKKIARKAVLATMPVDSFGLDTHPNPTRTVQYQHELPTVRTWGTVSATAIKFGGLLNIWAATQVDNPYVKGVGLAAGTSEVFGGTLYFGGALTGETSMMAWGSSFARYSGGIGLTVVGGYTFIQDVRAGNVRNAIGSGANTATGITMLVSSNPIVLAAIGTFAGSYNGSRWISEKTGWGQRSGAAGAATANFIMGDDPGLVRTGLGYTAGVVVTSVGTVIVEPTVFVGKKIGQGAVWVGGKAADAYDSITDAVGYEFCMPFVNCSD